MSAAVARVCDQESQLANAHIGTVSTPAWVPPGSPAPAPKVSAGVARMGMGTDLHQQAFRTADQLTA